MTDNPPSDEQRREAEQRQRRLFNSARIARGISDETLENLPDSALADLLVTDRILRQYLALIAHGEQVNGWTGEDLEDARYRLVAMFRQWATEQGEVAKTVLRSRSIDPFRMLLRFALGLAKCREDELFGVLVLLGLDTSEDNMRHISAWAHEMKDRYNQLNKGDRGDGDD